MSYCRFFVIANAATAIAVALVFAYVVGRSSGIFDETGHVIGRDFANQWAAGRLLTAGRVDEIFNPSAFQAAQAELFGRSLPQHFWSYPPTALFLAAPFAPFPYPWALAFWLAATAALYWLAVLGPRGRAVPSLLLLTAPASLVNVFFGQNGFLTAALLVGGFRLLDRAPWLAGVLFGLLAFKPQLGLLIPVALIALRRWRPFAGATLTAAVATLASLAVFGSDAWRYFFDLTLPFQLQAMRHGTGVFLNMMPSFFASGRILGLNAPVTLIVQGMVGIGVALLVYRGYLRRPHDPATLALLLVGTVIVTPQVFNYDLTLVSAAILYLLPAAGAELHDRAFRIALILAWIVPVVVPGFNANGLPVTPLILLWLCLLLTSSRAGASPRLAAP